MNDVDEEQKKSHFQKEKNGKNKQIWMWNETQSGNGMK